MPFPLTQHRREEKKRKKEKKATGRPRKNSSHRAVCPRSRPTPNRSLAETSGLRALGHRGWVPAENTYWAAPTLLSLFASTLAGFVSSTSCWSSVIGAACGGHLQASPSQQLPAPGAQALRTAPSPRLPRALRRSAHPGRPGAARHGGAANLDTSGRRRLVGAGVRAGEGRGGPKPSDGLPPQPGRPRPRARKPVELVGLGAGS